MKKCYKAYNKYTSCIRVLRNIKKDFKDVILKFNNKFLAGYNEFLEDF